MPTWYPSGSQRTAASERPFGDTAGQKTPVVECVSRTLGTAPLAGIAYSCEIPVRSDA